MAPTGGECGEIATELSRHIANHVADHALGRVYIDETGFVLSRQPPVVLCPDVAFVSEDRLPPRSERSGFMQLVPDLAVEIVSPSDRMSEVRTKVDEHLTAGVRLVWFAEPRHRRVTVYHADASPIQSSVGDDLFGEDVLPGFRLAVARIFE